MTGMLLEDGGIGRWPADAPLAPLAGARPRPASP